MYEHNVIGDLESQLSKLNNKQTSLKNSIKKLKAEELRFYNIFKNSAVALWEEDFSEPYLVLKKLPCKTGKEYTRYLDSHPELLKELISKIKIISINEATLTLMGVDNKEQLISSLDTLFIKESFSVFRDQFVTLATGKYNYECETLGRKCNGEEFQVLLTVFFPDKLGSSVFISMMDITDIVGRDRKKTMLLVQTEEQKKIASVLMNIIFSLSSKNNLNDILDSVLGQIEEIIPYSSANLMLLKGNKLNVVRHRGYDKFGAEGFMNDLGEESIPGSIAKAFLETSKVQLIEDSENYPGWTCFPETSYIKSAILIPVEWQDNTIGLLTLDSCKKFAFTMEDVKKLRIIGSAVTISIQRAKLFEREQEALEKRKRSEALLSKFLEDKELLLQQVHHRVKNNLSVIIALINLQDNYISNASEKRLLEELSQRVYSIALVHERLYENIDLSSIDFYSYVYDLYNSIRSVMEFRSDIQFKIDIPENIYFNMDQLVPLGLILNELLTNSLKYSFPESGGVISLELVESKHYFTLSIADSGIGFPEQILEEKETHLGLLLVNSLVEQINGSVKFSNNKGANVTIKFPNMEKKYEQ